MRHNGHGIAIICSSTLGCIYNHVEEGREHFTYINVGKNTDTRMQGNEARKARFKAGRESTNIIYFWHNVQEKLEFINQD